MNRLSNRRPNNPGVKKNKNHQGPMHAATGPSKTKSKKKGTDLGGGGELRFETGKGNVIKDCIGGVFQRQTQHVCWGGRGIPTYKARDSGKHRELSLIKEGGKKNEWVHA